MKSGHSREPSGFTDGLFQLHPTLDALSTFIYVKDRDLRIVSANRAFCDALGVTREELLGTPTVRYLGESGPESERVDREVITSGVPRLGVVESYPAADGLHWVVTDKAPVRAPDGTVVGLVGSSIDITAQKESDERLRHSESQLRFLTEHMADILWTMDLQFHTTFVTPSVERVLGFTPEERRLQSLPEMVTPESAGRILAELERQLQYEVSGSAESDRTLTIDLEYYRKNGSTIWMETLIQGVRDDAGTLVGISGVSRDITERRKAEEALRRSETQLRFLTDNTADVIWTMDLEFHTTYISPSVERVLGFTPDEWMQLPFDRMATPDSVAREYAALQRELAAEASGAADPHRTLTIEVEMNHKDGSTVWMEMVIRAIRDDVGKLIGMVGVSRDITERRDAERALRQSEEKYRTLFDQSIVPMTLIAPDGRMLEVNDAWLRLMGYCREDMESFRAVDLFEFPEARDELLELVLRKGFLDSYESRIRRKDGTLIDALRSISVRYNPDGSILGFQTVVRDITVQKQVERDLRDNERLLRASERLARLGGWSYDVATSHMTWTQGVYDVHEMDSSASIDHVADSLKCYAPGAREQVEAAFRRAVEEGAPYDLEVPFTTTKGNRRWVRTVARPEMKNGEVASITGNIMDVTERHEADEALRASEEKYRTLFEQSVDAINLVGVDGRIIEANAAWFSLFGYTPDDLGSYNAADVYVEPEGRARFLQAIVMKDTVEDELQFRRKDGSVFDCHRVVTVRRSKDGSVVGYQTVFHDVTETRRAERALRESEQRFRMVLSRSPVIMAQVDRDLRYVWIHHPHPDFDPALACGKRDDELADNEGSRRLTQLKQQVIETGRPARATISFPVSDGERTYDVAAEPLLDDGRMAIGATTVAFDITERMRAEAALKSSEEKYRALFELSKDAAYLVSPDGHFLEVNQAWIDMFGYSHNEAASLHVTAIYEDPRIRDEYLLPYIKQHGDIVDWEVRFKKKDGAVMDCLCSVVSRRDSTGITVCLQGIVRDITGQKRAQQELKNSEEKYRSIFDQSLVPISLFSPEGRLMEVNDAWLNLFGYSREDCDSITAYALYDDPKDRDLTVRRILTEGMLVDDPVRHRRKDGGTIEVLRSINVRRNPDGAVTGYQTVYRDVTELSRTRDELLASREQLRRLALRIQEAREDERTAIARELHDHFGQELTALRLDLESLTNSPPPAGDAGLIRIRGILQLVDRMSQEVRRVISEMRPGMLDDLGLSAALEWQAGQFSERTGITCNLILTADDTHLPPSVSTGLFRAFQELLSNVARHSGAHYVDVSLVSDGDYIYLAVVDDGRGITDDELHGSASLGILGIQERIRACGGDVTLQGEPGKGTTATVTIPLRTDTGDGWQTRLGLH